MSQKIIKITFICLAIFSYSVSASVHNKSFLTVDDTGTTTDATCSWFNTCPKK